MTTTVGPSNTDAVTRPAQSPSLEMNMQTDSLEAVELGDTTQWIRVPGTNVSNPLLLLIQQGPGLPMLNEVRRFEHLFGLEEHFTVVYWDQRAAGVRSALPTLRPHTLCVAWWTTQCRSSGSSRAASA